MFGCLDLVASSVRLLAKKTFGLELSTLMSEPSLRYCRERFIHRGDLAIRVRVHIHVHIGHVHLCVCWEHGDTPTLTLGYQCSLSNRLINTRRDMPRTTYRCHSMVSN